MAYPVTAAALPPPVPRPKQQEAISPDPLPFHVVEIPNKFVGVVASRNLAKGETILVELPALSFSSADLTKAKEPEKLRRMMQGRVQTDLTRQQRAEFWALHDSHCDLASSWRVAERGPGGMESSPSSASATPVADAEDFESVALTPSTTATSTSAGTKEDLTPVNSAEITSPAQKSAFGIWRTNHFSYVPTILADDNPQQDHGVRHDNGVRGPAGPSSTTGESDQTTTRENRTQQDHGPSKTWVREKF